MNGDRHGGRLAHRFRISIPKFSAQFHQGDQKNQPFVSMMFKRDEVDKYQAIRSDCGFFLVLIPFDLRCLK